MAEESETQSGFNAREYLRLFRQEGRSLAGLVLLEIGWVLLLVLASKLTGAAGEGAAEHGKVAQPSVWSVPLNFLEIWAIGGLSILFLWLLYSGLFSQALRIVYTPLRPLLHFLFTIVIVLIGVLDAIVSAILAALTKLGLSDLKKAHRREWIEKKRKEKPDSSEEEASEAYDQWVAELKAKEGEDALEKLILKQKRFDPFAIVWRMWQSVGGYVLTPTQSSVRIGIAVPVIYAQTGGRSVRAAPFVNLLRAYATAKSRAKRLPAMANVRMIILPIVVPIPSHERARIWARLLSLDMLIWCDVPVNARESAHVFLQEFPRWGSEEPEEDRFGTAYQRTFFPFNTTELRIDPPAFALGAGDEIGAYAGLLIAVALAICKRQHRTYISWLKTWDRTLRLRDKRVAELLEHLALDVLPRMTPSARNDATAPSIREQLASLIGSWAGMHMKEDTATKDLWQQPGEARYGQHLKRILEGCIRLAPESPENWFRLGAIACVLGDKGGALGAFHRAAEKVAGHMEFKPIGAQVMADHVLRFNLSMKAGLGERLAWAHWATHAACALFVGDEREVKEIREMLASPVALIASHSGRTVAIEVLEALLAERSEEAGELAAEAIITETEVAAQVC